MRSRDLPVGVLFWHAALAVRVLERQRENLREVSVDIPDIPGREETRNEDHRPDRGQKEALLLVS